MKRAAKLQRLITLAEAQTAAAQGETERARVLFASVGIQYMAVAVTS